MSIANILLAIFLFLEVTKTSTVNLVPPTSSNCPLSSANLYPTCKNWADTKVDYIIVGAGAAGCTLANRLTENPRWNVLLIENGEIPSNLSEIPALYVAQQNTPEDWQFRAVGDGLFSGYKNQKSYWAKGKALGGSSTINAMIAVAGVPADYDYWAFLGNEDWNWNNVTRYFDRVWSQVQVTNYRSTEEMRDTLAAAVQELGVDSTGSSTFGYGDVPMQTSGGQRNSHAKAYLTPIRNRANLCVVTGLYVTGLWFDSNNRVQGVLVNSTAKRQIRARKEVILSAGAVQTPKLLLLSGIGPKDQLQNLGIPSRVDLPVGKNLMDHMYIPVFVQIPIIDPRISTGMNQKLDEYCQNRTALNNLGLTNYQGYINPQNATTQNDPFHRPTIELIHVSCIPQEPILNLMLDRFGYLQYYQDLILDINQDKYLQMILVELLHPKSRGTIELASTNPFDEPRIYPQYFSNPEDVQTLLAGVQFVKNLIQTESLRELEIIDLKIPHCPNFNPDSDEYWECYFKTFAASIFHPSGSCTMGNDSTKSVVNSRLQVWGVDNLRVVDTSVFPNMITGHTNIPCGMVAEKAADYIKADCYNCS